MPDQPPRRRRTLVVLVALAAVGAVVGSVSTASLLWDHDAGPVLRHHAASLAAALVAVAGLTLVNLTIRWVRWHNLVRRCGLKVPTRDSLTLYAATLPAIATPLYVGELVRPMLLRRRRPDLLPAFVVVWLLERLGDVGAVALLVLAGSHRWAWLAPVQAGWAVIHLAAARTVHSDRGALRTVGTFGAVVVTSLSAWVLPALGLLLVVHTVGSGIGAGTVTESFGRSTLLGGVSGLPLGAFVTGVTLGNSLTGAGLAAAPTAVVLAVFRAGTSWFAVSLGVLCLWRWRSALRRTWSSGGKAAAEHFDELSARYADELPGHIRARLIDRKIAEMEELLGGAGIAPGSRGLEVGCGHGWYATQMATAGYRMTGFDVAAGQVLAARSYVDQTWDPAAHPGLRPPALTVADAAALPYADGTFDFAYAINVVHHIVDPQARERALAEIVRVLRPGGAFLLQEMNTSNPLLRFYMGYVFPVMHDIDDGTEVWVDPRRLPIVDGARWEGGVRYFTFLPEFVPAGAVRRLERLERRLERTFLRRSAAHFVAQLVKQATPRTTVTLPDPPLARTAG